MVVLRIRDQRFMDEAYLLFQECEVGVEMGEEGEAVMPYLV